MSVQNIYSRHVKIGENSHTGFVGKDQDTKMKLSPKLDNSNANMCAKFQHGESVSTLRNVGHRRPTNRLRGYERCSTNGMCHKHY